MGREAEAVPGPRQPPLRPGPPSTAIPVPRAGGEMPRGDPPAPGEPETLDSSLGEESPQNAHREPGESTPALRGPLIRIGFFAILPEGNKFFFPL